jgi:hypothetical protein
MRNILMLSFSADATSRDWFNNKDVGIRSDEILALASPDAMLWAAGQTSFGSSSTTIVGPSLQFVYRNYDAAITSFDRISDLLCFPSGTQLIHRPLDPVTEERKHIVVRQWPQHNEGESGGGDRIAPVTPPTPPGM